MTNRRIDLNTSLCIIANHMNNINKNTVETPSFAKFLRTIKYVNGYLLFMSLIWILAIYDQCDACKSDYKIPSFPDLKQITGKYAPVYRYKNLPSGGLLLKGRAKPLSCGYLKEAFIGMPATGWIDKDERIYQLKVNGQIVCEYSIVVKNYQEKNNKDNFKIPILIFIFLCITQFIFIKLDKLFGRKA